AAGGPQAEYFRHLRAAAGRAPAPNPAGAGTLRHYSIYRNGWLRIDDPSTQTAIIQKPDEGNAYLLDARSHTPMR
ncbi:MAG: hypothetical protein ABR591_06100, partial [Candidatus Velthaea sp.]